MKRHPVITLTVRLLVLMSMLLLLAMPHAVAAGAEETDLRLYWDKGLKLSSEDKAFKLAIGGRIHADWAAISAGEALDDALDVDADADGDVDAEPLEGFGTEFRRVRFNMQGEMRHGVFFKAQLDFAPALDGDEVQAKDVYVGYQGVPGLGRLTFGQFFAPFSLVATTSSNYITFMERSIGADVFAPSRRIGAAFGNTVMDGRLHYSAGAFSTSTGESEFDNEDNFFSAGRVAWLPWSTEDGQRFLHLGLAHAHQFVSGERTIRYRARPESHLAPYLVDTDSLDADGSDLLGGEAALVLGPLSLQGEYVANWVHRPDSVGDDLYLQGYYAFVSWFITGEHRPYKAGVFSRVSPNENFSPADGGPGAWELALRWSALDLNSEDVEGGELRDITAGVNWYLNPNARVMLNYVHAMVEDRDSGGVIIDDRESADIVQMRFQVDW